MSKYTSQRYWLIRDGEAVEVFNTQTQAAKIAELLNAETAALRQQITKLEGDLAAAKDIIVQAGQKVTELQDKLVNAKVEIKMQKEQLAQMVILEEVMTDLDASITEETAASTDDTLNALTVQELPVIEESPVADAPKLDSFIPYFENPEMQDDWTGQDYVVKVRIDWQGRGWSSGTYRLLGTFYNKYNRVTDGFFTYTVPMTKCLAV